MEPSIFQTFNIKFFRGNGKQKSPFDNPFAATPWLGQVAWGDHDMFHSGDKSPKAAKFNVVAKALSGSSIYLSEYAEEIKAEYVNGLCYEDGLLLRPLAPATPLPEDLFHQMYDERLSAAIAPIAHQCATIVVYGTHRRGPLAKQTFKRTVTTADYAEAGGMLQPYHGLWKAPKEGLLVYDWYNQTAKKLGEGYEVALNNFDYRVLQLSPIQNGWSVIGRTDKYLSAAAACFSLTSRFPASPCGLNLLADYSATEARIKSVSLVAAIDCDEEFGSSSF